MRSDKVRAAAKNDAILWWGITRGGFALRYDSQGNNERKRRGIKDGFPPDWTGKNIYSFTRGTIENYPSSLQDLLTIAEGETQRSQVLLGAIQGSIHSSTEICCEAVNLLSVGSLRSGKAQQLLKVFIQDWSQSDSKAAEEWLSQQPQDEKAQIMWKAIGDKN